jgi:hypothetical protein
MAASHPLRAAEVGGSADNVAFEERQFNQCGTGGCDGPPASPILVSTRIRLAHATPRAAGG